MPGDIELPPDPDSEGFKQWTRGGGGAGTAGGGPPPAPGGFRGGGGFSSIGSGGLNFGQSAQARRAAMIRKLMAAIKSLQGDNVNASLTPGEFVMNPVATAAHRPQLEQWNAQGNREREFFLGGLVDDLPLPDGWKEPAKRGLEIGGTLALTAAGVPAPLAAAGSNLAVRGGEADSFGDALGRSAMAGGEAFVGQQLHDYGQRRDMTAANKRNIDSMAPPAAPPGDVMDLPTERWYPEEYGRPFFGGGYVRRPTEEYAYGGYVGMRPGFARDFTMGGRGQGPMDVNPRTQPPAPQPGFPGPGYFNPGATREGVGGVTGTAVGGLQQAWGQGMFNPSGNPMAMEAAVKNLQAQGRAQDRGDVLDLNAMGLGDPTMAAARLMQNRSDRARTQSMALAGIGENQANRAQDFWGGMFQNISQAELQDFLSKWQSERDKSLKRTKGKK